MTDVMTTTSVVTWKQEMQRAIRDPVELCERLGLPSFAYAREAIQSFPLFAPLSYVDRMQPGCLDDPLLQQVLPIDAELESPSHYRTDPVGDWTFHSQPGLLQKYRGRVLLIVTGLCAIHCRYCFRRHYPYHEEPNSIEQWQPALEQIANDESIQEVILSGGDPLTLSDNRLSKLVEQLDSIPHLQRLRIHTRLPIVIPSRITPSLLQWLNTSRLTKYMVIHANHVQELNEAVWQSVDLLRAAGVILLNQTVLLRGVNDSFEALYELCRSLSDHAVVPYYLHQLDPVIGASHFEVPIRRGLELVSQLRANLPGFAAPRYVQEIEGESNKRVLA